MSKVGLKEDNATNRVEAEANQLISVAVEKQLDQIFVLTLGQN